MNVLVDNGRRPATLGLRDMLLAHINHEKEVYRRGFEYDLRKIEARIHIIDGLIKCLASIDEVVTTIKTSASTSAAKSALMQNFILDDAQATAVLNMRLSSLAKLEVEKLEQERAKLVVEADRVNNILSTPALFNEQLKNGWRETIKKFGDARRTQILNIENEEEEPVEVKQLQFLLTNQNNYIINESSSLIRRAAIVWARR